VHRNNQPYHPVTAVTAQSVRATPSESMGAIE